MKIKSFLSQVEHARIVAAIQKAEANSRGEIRIHVSHRKVADAQAAAALQFEKLGMSATRERNGVMLFIAPVSQRFAVIGDSGIHGKCGEAFWSEVTREMAEAFREGRFSDGIATAVGRVGDALATHFPRVSDRPDADELPNEVSED